MLKHEYCEICLSRIKKLDIECFVLYEQICDDFSYSNFPFVLSELCARMYIVECEVLETLGYIVSTDVFDNKIAIKPTRKIITSFPEEHVIFCKGGHGFV